MNEEKGLATIPFWKHEFEILKHRKREQKLAIALAIVTATSTMLLIHTKLHR